MIYRRPELTGRVFQAISAARPHRLLVVADGPRPGEEELCGGARRITEHVDWPCEVSRLYAEQNMGCAQRMSSGISWVFEQVEEAIILEDDCLPDASFFPFCSELLSRYRDDERVMMISGDNLQRGRTTGPFSYYFSRYVHIWGWATWRRAWRTFDLEMRLWPGLRNTCFLDSVLGHPAAVEFWRRIFDQAHARLIDTWDFAWVFACWAQHGLAIMPERNLVSNLGFAEEATHTRSPDSVLSAMPVATMRFPLRHPDCVVPSLDADRRTFELAFAGRQGHRALFRALIARLSRAARGRG